MKLVFISCYSLKHILLDLMLRFKSETSPFFQTKNMPTTYAPTSLHGCAGSSEPSLFAYVIYVLTSHFMTNC